MSVQVRKFHLLEDGVTKIWEIAWEGPEVEITSGKLGTNGRGRARTFETAQLRDAFVEGEIRKIVKKGYIEGGPGLEPPDIPDDTPKIPATLSALKRRAWYPTFEAGEEPNLLASKVGGVPWLAADEAWPELDGEPMPLLLQVNFADLVGASMTEPRLLQIFYAPAGGYDDWEPWTPTKHIRFVTPRGASLTNVMQAAGQGIPPHRITKFSVVDEYPDGDELRSLGVSIDDALSEYFEEHNERRLSTKIGGYPRWLQGTQYPRCSRTRFPCGFIAQIDSSDRFVDFGDAGVGYVFQSPAYADLMTMLWQCC